MTCKSEVFLELIGKADAPVPEQIRRNLKTWTKLPMNVRPRGRNMASIKYKSTAF